MIAEYRFGSMRIGEVEYNADLKIIGGKVVPSWWRKEGHSVTVEDVGDILEARPEVLVVGMGEPGKMIVSRELKKSLEDASILLIEEPTAKAVAIFNDLLGRGKKVAGAFHLTC